MPRCESGRHKRSSGVAAVAPICGAGGIQSSGGPPPQLRMATSCSSRDQRGMPCVKARDMTVDRNTGARRLWRGDIRETAAPLSHWGSTAGRSNTKRLAARVRGRRGPSLASAPSAGTLGASLGRRGWRCCSSGGAASTLVPLSQADRSATWLSFSRRRPVRDFRIARRFSDLAEESRCRPCVAVHDVGRPFVLSFHGLHLWEHRELGGRAGRRLTSPTRRR
jgi:hypothetical protein